MASYTAKGKHTPVMVVSKSAHKLAIRLARRGNTVVYRGHTLLDIYLSREDVGGIIKSKHWFQHFILGAWTINDAGITHRSGGTILFMVYSSFKPARAVELEVHV